MLIKVNVFCRIKIFCPVRNLSVGQGGRGVMIKWILCGHGGGGQIFPYLVWTSFMDSPLGHRKTY